MIKRDQLEQAVVIFEHFFNCNHMKDEGYKNKLKLHTRDGFEVSMIDVLSPSLNEHDHRYDGYKTEHVFKRIKNTKFGFEVDDKEVEKLNLEECFFVVYYRSNEKYISGHFSPGPFTCINDQELNFLYNQIAL